MHVRRRVLSQYGVCSITYPSCKPWASSCDCILNEMLLFGSLRSSCVGTSLNLRPSRTLLRCSPTRSDRPATEALKPALTMLLAPAERSRAANCPHPLLLAWRSLGWKIVARLECSWQMHASPFRTIYNTGDRIIAAPGGSGRRLQLLTVYVSILVKVQIKSEQGRVASRL